MTYNFLIVDDYDHYRAHKEHDWTMVIYTEHSDSYLGFMSTDRDADTHAYLCPRASLSDDWLRIQQHLSMKKIVIHPLNCDYE